MADAEVKRIIEVEARGAESLAELHKRVVEMQQVVSNLEEQGNELTEGTEEYQKALVDLKTAQQQYNAEMRISVKENQAAKGSYNDLVNQLARLKEQWKQSAPGTDEYKQLTAEVNRVKKALEDADHDIGNWQRNVGNYANSIRDAFGMLPGPIGNTVAGVKNLTTAAKAFGKVSLVMVLGLIVTALDKVINSLKGNEENMQAVTAAMAPLNAVADIFKVTMDILGKAVARVAQALSDVLVKLNLFRDRMVANQEITKMEIDLQKRRRAVVVENAQLELKAEEARAKAADKAGVSVKDRLAALNDAADAEKQILNNNLDIAQKEYDIAKKRAEQTANDAAANDALAQAEANLYNVRSEHLRGMRRIISQTSAAIKEMQEGTAKAAKDTADEVETMAVTLADIEAALEKASGKLAAALKAEGADMAEFDKWLIGETSAAMAEADRAIAEGWADIDDQHDKRLADRKASLQAYARATASILNDVAGAYQNQIKAEVDAGRMSEAEGERRFKGVKALQYAVTSINTAAAVVSALSDPSAPSFAVRAVNAAAALSAGVANLVKIHNATLGNTQTSSATGAGVQSVTTIAPAVNENTAGTRVHTSGQEVDRLGEIIGSQKVYILQSDLEAADGARRVQVAESSY